MKIKRACLLVLLSTLPLLGLCGGADSATLALSAMAKGDQAKLYHRLSYELPSSGVYDIHLRCLQVRGSDSLGIYDLHYPQVKLKEKLGTIDLYLSAAQYPYQLNADYAEIVSRFELQACGLYIQEISLQDHFDSTKRYRSSLLQTVDSDLSYSSGLRDRVNSVLALPLSKASTVSKGKHQGSRAKKTKSESPSKAQVTQANNRLKRQLRSMKGLDVVPAELNGQSYSSFYYKGFYLGRYPLGSSKKLSEQAHKEKEALKSDPGSLVSNELEGFNSIGTQMKALNTQAGQRSQSRGTIDLSSYRSSAQDPQSAISTNYTELLANVDMEVMGMPINLEGFYTSQDAHRQAKSSYFRIHYDIETAKSKLQKNIDSYKSKLNQTSAKGQGLSAVYTSYAQGLESQKESLLRNLAKDYELSPETISSNKGNVNAIIGQLPDTGTSAESLSAVQGKKAKLTKDKADIERRYQQIENLEQKALKYYSLIEQYKNKNHLDSAINYKRMEALSQKEPSYKDMSKAAAGILPEGKTKQFVTGLTHLDAGIINKYESDYTMSGQTMKGLSMGYDLGLFTSGVSLGSTEYVSREGNVDHYSTMLVRADTKGSKNHKVGLLYSITTPSKSMGIDENYIGQQNIKYPSFSAPTQITSIVYDGKISKYLLIHTELASSFKKGQATSFDMAHAAVNNNIEFNIPKTSISLKGAWEHLGNSFENNTLPYIRSGTERYTLGSSFDLFRSFLSAKIEYNYLLQQNFSTQSGNTKWGFELRTHSKRYPSVSLSYKPFSTFRSYSDTLQIAQRPIQGEVWTARSSYQIKRHQSVHRFTAVYNQNSSSSDSLSYSSNTAQLSYSYTRPKISINATMGRISLPEDFADGSGQISSYTSSIGISKTIGEQLNLSLSPDMSLCKWGVQRLSGTIGLSYKMSHKPITIRCLMRYSSYKLKQNDISTPVYAGQLGINWQFKSRAQVKQQQR